jgi:hypothetical protein
MFFIIMNKKPKEKVNQHNKNAINKKDPLC